MLIISNLKYLSYFWEADLVRNDIDAMFGEACFISDKTELTVGLRNYDQKMNLVASDGYYSSYSFGISNLNFKSSESGTIPKYQYLMMFQMMLWLWKLL